MTTPRHKLMLVIADLRMGGAQRVIVWLARRLVDAGHLVKLVTFEPSGSAPYFAVPEAAELLQLGQSGKRLAAIRDNLSRIDKLRRAIKDWRPDVVLSFVDTTNVLAIAASRLEGVPIIACERTDPRQSIMSRPWYLLRRLVYPLTTALTVQTSGAARSVRYWTKRVVAIPNAVPRIDLPERSAERGASGEKVVAGVGRLSREKGFDLLIDAFVRVAERHPDVRLVIWGDGPERATLEAQASASAYAHRISLPGSSRDISAALAGADVFVLPSRLEGFPNALAEAMSAGLPVVAANCDHGPRDLIRNGIDGLLVKAGDASDIGDGVSKLLSDSELRQRLARTAALVADRFAEDRIFAMWHAQIAQAVASKGCDA